MTTATPRYATHHPTPQRIATRRRTPRHLAPQRTAPRRYYVSALIFARAALARGPLTEHRVMGNGRGVFWRHRNRLFSAKTVRILIDAGEAVRVGNTVEQKP